MKKFYKKILPWFGASYYFFRNKPQDFLQQHQKNEKSTIIAKINKKLPEEEKLNTEKSDKLKDFINELNEIEVYLLVTDIKKEKFNKPILLLLHTEDRLNSEQAIINYRHLKFLFSSKNGNSGSNKNKNFSISEIVRSNWFTSLAKTFRGGKSYYVNNLGGYKSICPMFFDKASAEDFLLQTSKDAFLLLKTLPLDSNKEILEGLLNTKILSIGLGDFIDYFSIENNQNYLEKVEFLFVPCLEVQNNYPKDKDIKKRINNILTTKNFKMYQKHYYNLNFDRLKNK